MTDRAEVSVVRGRFGRLAWTRGRGCSELVELLGASNSFRVEGDLMASCVDNGADGLVTRKLSDFDLVPAFIPYAFEDFATVGSVTAAVADGPHSELAARVAATIAEGLGVPAEVATVFRSGDEEPHARERLARLRPVVPGVKLRAVEGPSAVSLVEQLAPDALLVVGAAGGSWLQRQIYGPGHRLLVKAPSGAIVVRDAPRRCYHQASDASGVAFGPQMSAVDAGRLIAHPSVPVAQDGLLVGVVRSAAIHGADGGATVADVMEAPVSVRVDEPTDAADEIRAFLDGGPVPVVDRKGRLVGVM